MFAGPNGSGKSTLKTVLPPALLGVYLNPDDIERGIREAGFLDLPAYGMEPTTAEAARAQAFFRASPFLAKVGLAEAAGRIGLAKGDRLDFTAVAVNAYFASVAADFLRGRLLAQRRSFTCETVMSSPDKVALLEQAQCLGFRTYLYFIATDDPEINVSRVHNRVRMSGHPVPEDKIISRYARSLDLLMAAVRHAHRAHVFDCSNHSLAGIILVHLCTFG